MSPIRHAFYLPLLSLRLIVSLTSYSTIHPDEVFQNPEIAAAVVFPGAKDYLLRTWEWVALSGLGQGEPVRSIGPVLASTGWAFGLLKAVRGDEPSGHDLFLTQRLVMFLFSIIIDCVLSSISPSPLPLLLFSLSPATFTYLLRPFSNSLETVLLALAFLCWLRHVESPRGDRKWLVGFGVVVAAGVWTRVTFVGFVGVLVGDMVLRELKDLRSRSTKLGSAFVGLMEFSLSPILSFLPLSICFILLDTHYFSFAPSIDLLRPSNWIITPLNLLKYNSDSQNLKNHGLHPWWLHSLVNWPLMFGISGLVGVMEAVWELGRKKRKTKAIGGKRGGRKGPLKLIAARDPVQRQSIVYLLSILIPTSILSLFPHQEPRFLLPLVIPLVLLLPHTSLLSPKGSSRLFWIGWTLHSLIIVIIFGYFHQGGLTPVSLKLNEALRSGDFGPGRVDMVFWKTFMPARHESNATQPQVPHQPPKSPLPISQALLPLSWYHFSKLFRHRRQHCSSLRDTYSTPSSRRHTTISAGGASLAMNRHSGFIWIWTGLTRCWGKTEEVSGTEVEWECGNW